MCQVDRHIRNLSEGLFRLRCCCDRQDIVQLAGDVTAMVPQPDSVATASAAEQGNLPALIAIAV